MLFSKDAIVGLQTDDTFFACNKNYRRMEQTELEKAGFLAKHITQLTAEHPLTFNGAHLEITSNTITVSQSRQCEKISIVTNASQYVAERARGAYISSVCQPQAAFALSYAAQTSSPDDDDIKLLNKCLQWQIDNKQFGLTYVKLDMETLRVIVFTDSSFANNKDNSSQIGYVLVLADGNNKCNLIHWSSIKCKRVTRSVLASELYAMGNGFDTACVIKHTVDAIRSKDTPLIICIDSFSLWECLVKLGTTREKRLMIDVGAIRQSYERREIAEIVWIEGTSNPADSMTKASSNSALNTILNNEVRIEKAAWVERGG